MSYLSDSLQVTTNKLHLLNARTLLAHVHGGELFRQTLPKLMRISAVMLLITYIVLWVSLWPTVYEELERWDLVKAFLSHFTALITGILAAMITVIRARHLESLPADDFVALRSTALLLRWTAEVALVYVLGMGLSTLILPLTPLARSLFNDGSSGVTFLSLLLGTVSLLATLIIIPMFLVLYALANTIDLSLAIEFNTRAERPGRN